MRGWSVGVGARSARLAGGLVVFELRLSRAQILGRVSGALLPAERLAVYALFSLK